MFIRGRLQQSDAVCCILFSPYPVFPFIACPCIHMHTQTLCVCVLHEHNRLMLNGGWGVLANQMQ